MGRATRWLRSLWGGKKENKEYQNYPCYGVACSGGDDRREKKRWSFTKSSSDHPGDLTAPYKNEPISAAVEVAWFRSFYSDNEEQSKHAIAVAAATAAAADAAVAAAQAAVTVVRLTSQGRALNAAVPMLVGASATERAAAVRIQTAFRGYLAKKALRALKSLVKLQALVRGYLVRKQATGTLHSMQALIRAQAIIRAQRYPTLFPQDRGYSSEIRHRRSLDRVDETRSERLPSFHSRRLSGCLDGFDRSPKVVEMDTGRPRSRSCRRTSPVFDAPEDSNSYSNSESSPLQCQVPARITANDCRNFQDFDWCLVGEKSRSSATAQSTPRYLNSCTNAAATPARSVCGAAEAFRRFSNDPSCPNYMTRTESFEAKVRSQSAPKQRPEPAAMRRRLPLSKMIVESRASLSGVGMQRSCYRAQEAFSFRSAIVGRLDRSLDFARETERDRYVHRKW